MKLHISGTFHIFMVSFFHISQFSFELREIFEAITLHEKTSLSTDRCFFFFILPEQNSFLQDVVPCTLPLLCPHNQRRRHILEARQHAVLRGELYPGHRDLFRPSPSVKSPRPKLSAPNTFHPDTSFHPLQPTNLTNSTPHQPVTLTSHSVRLALAS